MGDQIDGRELRQMTEEDLRHKIEDHRKVNSQPGWDSGSGSGQTSAPPIKCCNCNDWRHHQSNCKKPLFCYNCRDSGHKTVNCLGMKVNKAAKKGLQICAYGMPGQIFYVLDLPELKQEAKKTPDDTVRAIVFVLEGRGTKARIKSELQYLMGYEWNGDVKRISGSEFLVSIPSKAALNVLVKQGKHKFITSDIVAVIEESDLDPEVFQVLQSVWVRALGIPPNARSEQAVMELAKLVGDPKEVHLPSLQWRSVWVKVACKDPSKICGTSEVFINKKGRRITWFYSDKLKQLPPSKPDDDLDDDAGDITDEEDLESQESHGWLESGMPPPITAAEVWAHRRSKANKMLWGCKMIVSGVRRKIWWKKRAVVLHMIVRNFYSFLIFSWKCMG